ncbi:MAG: hypothetical protein U0V72_15505 [Cytophagales bacterium]
MPTNKSIHIVSFDVPYPANYGGVQDVYFKIEQFKNLGYKVYLHCFQYKSEKKPQILNELCDKVFYYKRNLIWSNFSLLPHIVLSRKNASLLKNLTEINAPILFEGIHCSYYLKADSLKDRIKYLRLHNIEYKYYNNLRILETKLWKKLYFYIESIKLKFYDKNVKYANKIVVINQTEQLYYQKKYPLLDVEILPALFNLKVDLKSGTGKYVLFHGNLEVIDNIKSAEYIIKNIASSLSLPLIISGKNPSKNLLKICDENSIKCIANPSNEVLLELIQNAQVNLLYSFMNDGSKLKLFNVLSSGRFCVANNNVISSDNFTSNTVFVANTESEIIKTVNQISSLIFNSENIIKRNDLLNSIREEITLSFRRIF